MDKLYGAFLHLAGRACLVVGGGKVAERKIAGLLECGAVVTVIAPQVTDVIAHYVQTGTSTWEARAYRAGDAARFFLVIAATDHQEVNAQVCQDAEAAGRLCNAASDPARGNVALPAVVRRGKLTLAVSTSGAAPAVAKRIRQELEQQFGEEYAVYLDMLADARRKLLARVADEGRRTEIFQAIAGSDLLALLKQGRQEEAKQRIADLMEGQQWQSELS